jgi:signal transduction histidine kinase
MFVIAAAVSALVEVLLTFTLPDPATVAWSPTEVARVAQNRLALIDQNLDSGLAIVAKDGTLQEHLDAGAGQSTIFPLLVQDFKHWMRIGTDSTGGVVAGDRSDTTARGLAVYDADGRLLAWSATEPNLFSFDTVLPRSYITQRYLQSVRLEKNFFHSYLTDLQKLPGLSRIAGYVVARRLLSSTEPAGRSVASNTTFLDDLRDRSGHDLQIRFEAKAPDSSLEKQSIMRFELYGDRDDRASHVATVEIGQITPGDAPFALRASRSIRIFSMVMILFVILGWGISSIFEQRDAPVGFRKQLTQTFLILSLLIGVRLMLLAMDGLGDLFPLQFQDPSEFAGYWGLGAVQNPLELFITTLFAAIAVLSCWSIWIPKGRLAENDSWLTLGPEHGSIYRLALSGMVVLAVVWAALLTDVLAKLFEAIVMNGSVQYLIIRQVLPSSALLMMYISFLNIGVAYLFLVSLLLIFALRSTMRLFSEGLDLRRRFSAGAVFMLVLIIVVTLVFDWIGISGSATEYRFALAIGMGLLTVLMVAVDLFARNPLEHPTSFLYRLPRSSRSTLFILALSAVVVSPLVADKELIKDQDVAQGIVSENAQADIPYLKTTVEQALADAARNMNAWAGDQGEALRQSSFIVWMTAMKDHPGWQAFIDLRDGAGIRLSHFGTTTSTEELQQLQMAGDTALKMLNKPEFAPDTLNRAATLTYLVPRFGGTSSPLVVGSRKIAIPAETSGGTVKGPLTLTISLWTELPALQSTPPLLNLGQTGTEDIGGTEQIISNGEFIVAEYVNGVKRATNVPTLEVPASLPPSIVAFANTKQNFWRSSTIDSRLYETLYHRIEAHEEELPKRVASPKTPIDSAKSASASIITVSVPVPNFARQIEFGLRLNAIGLLYGIAIAILLLSIRQISAKPTRGKRFTLKFRDRIFLIVLAIALIPLIVVTNVTRNLLREPALYEAQDKLARDAAAIRDHIGHEISTGGATVYAYGLQQDVIDLAHTIGRNFNVYDRRGMLLASSLPEYYEASVLASHLSAAAMTELVLGKKPFFAEPLEIGTEEYQIGYQPVRSKDDGSLLAVISVATVGPESGTEGEIARTTSLIYGTFAALGLVLLAIGALFAARVAEPIVALIGATERVAKGKLGTSLPVNREDEIGELMHAFNAMTSELEKSRQLVAQTEREVAWKEMARQVAHEIKNPLTPMKLSVQHVEHAHESKDPNFPSVFRRVIRTLSEQIDVLTRIATEFARFGEMPRRKYALISVRSLAERAIALFDADRQRIRFLIDIPKNLPYVNVDEEEVRRAFVNLIRNAIQAIEGWGVIAIRAQSDRQMVHIRISDTGSGMNDETLAKAFDPNFSTKTSGMGLGLAIVKKTITDMGGIISVESKLGKGTTFIIDLPAREKPEGD